MQTICILVCNCLAAQVHDDELSQVVEQWEWVQQGAGVAEGR